jgi:protein-S-isoprenylcysteine O-methyltransferase Ste14
MQYANKGRLDMARDAIDSPDHAGVAFPPPLLLLVSILAGFLLRWVVPSAFLPTAAAQIFGPALTAMSFGLVGWAMFTFRRGGASVPTSESTDVIVSGGPYAFSRNPIYLSMVLLLLGLGVWSNSLWFLALAAIAALLLTYGVIIREERYLGGKFGAEYEAYRNRVRRWV